MDLLYDLEYRVNELRKARLSEIEYKNMTIKDFLDLGFNNSSLLIGEHWYNLGYKWHDKDFKTFGYESGDFGELNDKQLNCMIKYVYADINDNNYYDIAVMLVNEKEDSKYFIEV